MEWSEKITIRPRCRGKRLVSDKEKRPCLVQIPVGETQKRDFPQSIDKLDSDSLHHKDASLERKAYCSI